MAFYEIMFVHIFIRISSQTRTLLITLRFIETTWNYDKVLVGN